MATFSKRHYEAIAAACARARRNDDYLLGDTAFMRGVGVLQAEISQMFAEDNTRFDGERFAQDSGMRDTA